MIEEAKKIYCAKCHKEVEAERVFLTNYRAEDGNLVNILLCEEHDQELQVLMHKNLRETVLKYLNEKIEGIKSYCMKRFSIHLKGIR